jgi:hypothetical protein
LGPFLRLLLFKCCVCSLDSPLNSIRRRCPHTAVPPSRSGAHMRYLPLLAANWLTLASACSLWLTCRSGMFSVSLSLCPPLSPCLTLSIAACCKVSLRFLVERFACLLTLHCQQRDLRSSGGGSAGLRASSSLIRSSSSTTLFPNGIPSASPVFLSCRGPLVLWSSFVSSLL